MSDARRYGAALGVAATVAATLGASFAITTASPAGAAEPAFVSFARPYPQLARSGSVAVADVDLDGLADLVNTQSLYDPNAPIQVSLGTGGGSFDPPIVSSNAGAGFVRPTLADVNGDDRPDLLGVDRIGSKVSVALGDGAGHFGSVVQYATRSAPVWVAVADLDGDTDLDLAVAGGGGVRVHLGDGGGTFAASTAFTIPSTAVAAGDVDGDTVPDLVIAGNDQIHVSSGNGDGTFAPPTGLVTPGYQAMFLEDLNGDDLLDIVTVDGTGTTGALVGLGHGDGTFSFQGYASTVSCSCSVAVGDLNADDAPEIVITGIGTPSGVAVLVGRGDGTFVPSTDFPTPISEDPAVIADLNSDGLPDVVTAGSNTLTMLLNTPGLPPPPTIGTATAGLGSATVSWTAPASPGSSPITGYVVTTYRANAQFTPLSTTTFGTTTTSQTITGLTNGHGYRFRVAAVNALGVGQDSQLSYPRVIPGQVPAAPTIGSAVAANGQVTLSWSAPPPNGGAPITSYQVTPQVGYFALPTITYQSTATTQTITGLTNGTTYRFKVAARNEVGAGAPSLASNAATPSLAPPGAPTIGAAVAGDQSAFVSWTPPASNGGGTITGYRVTPIVGYFALPPITFGSTATTQLITGLTNGTTYRFKVQAINAAGPGATSTASSPVTPSA